MGDAVGFKGIFERGDHRILTNHILKGRRAVFAGQNLIGFLLAKHGGRITHREDIGGRAANGKRRAATVHSLAGRGYANLAN